MICAYEVRHEARCSEVNHDDDKIRYIQAYVQCYKLNYL